MPGLKIPRNATILVCDARKALFLTNHGDEDLTDIRIVETFEAEENPPTSEQGTDKPGRRSDGAAGHRSAMEPTDWHARAETAFAGQVAELLASRHEGERHPIIIAAPPQMLGDLRKKLAPQVASAIIAEIDKDLVHQPLDRIERSLTAD